MDNKEKSSDFTAPEGWSLVPNDMMPMRMVEAGERVIATDDWEWCTLWDALLEAAPTYCDPKPQPPQKRDVRAELEAVNKWVEDGVALQESMCGFTDAMRGSSSPTKD